MELLGTTGNEIIKNKNGENVHYNIISNDYQWNSRVSNTFVPNKTFVQLVDISPSYF